MSILAGSENSEAENVILAKIAKEIREKENIHKNIIVSGVIEAVSSSTDEEPK